MSGRVFRRLTKILLTGAALTATISSVCVGTDTTGSFHHVLAVSCPLKDSLRSHVTPWDYSWDSRQNSESDNSSISLKPKASRHILLVRHGQYHYAENDSECHLTNLGRQQLDLTGRRLRQLNFPYTRIFYSTMTRAIESTDEIIKHLPGVPATPCDLIREGAPFPPEPAVFNWPPEGNVAFEEDGPRIETAFTNYIHRAEPTQSEDSYEILVCHGNVIRYFVCRALQLPPEAWIRMSLDHGSLTWLTIRPTGTVSLRWLGNSGHMPPDKLSLS
ncbi:Serine/threonine-protein phosphatase PGAM5, mitochondrial [Echinococcus granulosus]|uniref:Serine/threonine-protein phosphatase PGAM5, mitochondrial n=1 Tax=Echinococcus granulosus TaxID=6210 RepID=U6J4B3_ECHGR|nr:Serine/threonine-protein phosphatase PGAM5 [Echinococcus granulosus]EUB57298.1 Serine/threonine-protein phosphatase PGAM5 [Echinococcus granulosus]KAH9281452.1 Serine/threonine-protein phosphatase PGAM5, mitochondrial [Echinococcus granulosus]CDS18808.1 serine:threonine protein phosphatase PGAM5 [Echinococcus granulosus]